MAYKNELGIAEINKTLNSALKMIATQDEEGRTIAITHIKRSGMSTVAWTIRILFGLFLLSSIIFQQPFDLLLPDFFISKAYYSWGWEWPKNLAEWKIFSWFSYVVTILLFGVYLALNWFKNRYYTTVPGTVMHFEKHDKMMMEVNPNEIKVALDPRIRPSAIVTTKPMPIEMPEVNADCQDQISIFTKHALILRATNTYTLLERGGFKKFLPQLAEKYISVVRDLVIKSESTNFNTFLIDPVNIEHIADSDRKTLDQLNEAELSVKLIREVSEIDELNISKINFDNTAASKRQLIIDALQDLATAYGCEIMECIPVGNGIDSKNLTNLATPLLSALERLKQQTEILKDIKEEEFSAEIDASIANKKIGLLEISKIIQEITSTKETLEDDKNKRSIIAAKTSAINNTADEHLTPVISKIEGMIAQVKAMGIDTAAYERFLTEMTSLIEYLEENATKLTPEIESVIVNGEKPADIIPQFDAVQEMLESTGIEKAINGLIDDKEDQGEQVDVTAKLEKISEEVAKVNPDDVVVSIQDALDNISTSTGVSIEAYSPDAVQEKINNITKKADITIEEVEETV